MDFVINIHCATLTGEYCVCLSDSKCTFRKKDYLPHATADMGKFIGFVFFFFFGFFYRRAVEINAATNVSCAFGFFASLAS